MDCGLATLKHRDTDSRISRWKACGSACEPRGCDKPRTNAVRKRSNMSFDIVM